MTDFVAKGELAPIPDDLTIPQFFLDAPAHPLRPERPANSPLFIEDATGRAISFAEVHFLVLCLFYHAELLVGQAEDPGSREWIEDQVQHP